MIRIRWQSDLNRDDHGGSLRRYIAYLTLPRRTRRRVLRFHQHQGSPRDVGSAST